MSTPRALALLSAAPHRLAFLIGVFNLVAVPGWWLARLIDMHAWSLGLPVGEGLHATLHGPVTIYALFMPFILGFLGTVFPRWMGFPDLPPRRYLPPAVLLGLGSLTLTVGLWSDVAVLAVAGLALMLGGWLIGAGVLLIVLMAHERKGGEHGWHGWSALAGWLAGLIGLAALTLFAAGVWPDGRRVALILGANAFVAGIFITVCHRMIPFFAGNVVADYVRWRPFWLLGALWTLLLADGVVQLLDAPAARLWTAGALALLLGLMLWRWTPRRAAPGLLVVLLWGFGWAVVSFALAALATVTSVPVIAAVHALLLGMGASLMVAMVTRVTQGHSGRPLAMTRTAWIAFGAVQMAVGLRLVAALDGESPAWLLPAAIAFALGCLPWAVRGAAIYLTPRTDGKPG